MESPAVEAVAVAAEVWGHHHASVALDGRVPLFFVADSVVSEAFFCPLADFDCAVVVSSEQPVALFLVDFVNVVRGLLFESCFSQSFFTPRLTETVGMERWMI